MAVVTALVLSACGSSAATVADKAELNGVGSATLIVPHASASDAQKAIEDYSAKIHGVDLYYLMVQQSPKATRYVCRARWYKDASAFQKYGRSIEHPDGRWPYLAMNCPKGN